MQYRIVDSIHILGLQDLYNYSRLNPIEITINSNSIVRLLSHQKKYTSRFISESLLFSARVQNDTEVIFKTSNSLTETKSALINSKIYKTLGVMYLS